MDHSIESASAEKVRKVKQHRRKLLAGSLTLGLGLAGLGGYAALQQTENVDLGTIRTGEVEIDKPMQVSVKTSFTGKPVQPGSEIGDSATAEVKNISDEPLNVALTGITFYKGNTEVTKAEVNKLKQYITFDNGLGLGSDGKVTVEGKGSKTIKATFKLPKDLPANLQNIEIPTVKIDLTATRGQAALKPGEVRLHETEVSVADVKAGKVKLDYNLTGRMPAQGYLADVALRKEGVPGNTVNTNVYWYLKNSDAPTGTIQLTKKGGAFEATTAGAYKIYVNNREVAAITVK
ncbi:hypothetical protein ACIBEA_21400 [Streptomyces sp. NPDC051555]|uniref:hypothetical protein n=1 Tax=Streptomyces sp. NPDC051555 TaxID=3365657 RepID=UPI0037ACBB32